MPESVRETVTTLLTSIEQGDPSASSELLPILYDELRSLARRRMLGLAPGQTLQATALVHEAYVRLVGDGDPDWDSKGHFFAAAARAMRNVVIDHERARRRLKRGGDRSREDLDDVAISTPLTDVLDERTDLIALDLALSQLGEALGERKSDVVCMRYFAGMTIEQIAAAFGVTTRTVDRDWRSARAWLFDVLEGVVE